MGFTGLKTIDILPRQRHKIRCLFECSRLIEKAADRGEIHCSLPGTHKSQ